MVAARETVVDLTRGKLVSVRVSALCANFGKAAPDARSSFGISALPDSEDLKKLIPVLKAGKSTQPVAQVAVWMVTDDVSEAALASRLRRRGNGRTINGASDAEMLRGIQLLARAGVGLEDKLLYKTLAERYAQTMGISNLANALTGAAGNDIVDVAGLSDPREEIRLNSAYSLKASRNPLVRPAMIAALRDPYDQVRCWAAEYIPNSGTPAAFDLLLALTRDKEEIVRVCAAKALAQLGDPRALKPLIELQEGDKDVGDYREAVAALRERLNGKSAPKR